MRCHTRFTTEHAGIEDVAIATFQHEGGFQTSLSSIWHSLDDRPSTRHLEVFFDGGYFATDDDFLGPIRVQGRSGSVTVISGDEVFDRYCEIVGISGEEANLARLGMYEDLSFLRCVHEERAAFPDFRTALRAHEVVDACYRSAEGAVELLVREP